MNKFISIASLIASFSCVSAFGQLQGYALFDARPFTVWEGFTAPTLSQLTPASAVNEAFLWGPSGDVPMVESILNGVPTNSTVLNSTWSVAAAWTDILNDPNFTLGVNNNSGAVAVASSSRLGGIEYGDGTFPVTGTTASNQFAGSTYTFFVIGWDANYSTPQSAAAASAAVGWSQPFSYTVEGPIGTPPVMPVVPFGIAGIIPEPSTIELAVLGGLSLLWFRRRTIQ